MGSRSNLLALSVIVAALAAFLILDRPVTEGGPASTRVLPDFEPGRVERLVWKRPGAPDVVVTRGADGDRIVEPIDAPAGRDAMMSVLGTLELLSFRRRDDGAVLGRPSFELLVDGHTLRFGDSIPQLGRTWVEADGRVYLVDDFAVHALDRTASNLRERDVFDARPHEIVGIELAGAGTSVMLDGPPMRLRVGGGWVRADPDHIAHMIDLVDSLVVVTFVQRDTFVQRGLPEAEPDLVVRVRGGAPDQEIRVFGRCDDGVTWLAETNVGIGCLPDRQVIELIAYLGTDLVDRSLAVARRPSAIRVGDVALERRGAAWFFADGTRADARAVGEWLEAVAALSALEVREDARELPVTVEIGEEKLSVDARGETVRRAGEPVVLVLPASDLFRPDPARFYDRAIFSEQPIGLRMAARGGERIVRGETHSDWDGGSDFEAIEVFRRAFGRLRAERFTDIAPRSPVVIQAVFDPPPGETEPHRYVLEIDRGCRARTDSAPAPFIVAADTCAALLRRW